MKEKIIDFGYYTPINRQQREFHASRAKNKLLIGGYGAGKSYPAIHESLFHCLDNPEHNFYIFRNTWDSVEENIQEDVLRVAEDAGVVKSWSKDRHQLVLVNDCNIYFRPLSLGKRIFKGYHMCGFFIDDPDTERYRDTISFLWSRLRNPPKVQAKRFQSIITANWEGHDWLWETYIRDNEEGGDDEFAYWIIPTTANPTLPHDYVEQQKRIHSQEWVDRYIYCKTGVYTGLIYHDFDVGIHHVDREQFLDGSDVIQRVLAIDVGLAHPTVVLKMCTDGKSVLVYDELYERGLLSAQVGNILVTMLEEDKYHRVIIDPSSGKSEQTSGMSVKKDLERNFGIHFTPGNNNVPLGISAVRDLLRPAEGPPRLFIDTGRCPHLTKEMGLYRFVEPSYSDGDNLVFKEEPDKRRGNDDCVDAMRYGVMFLRKFLRGLHTKSALSHMDEVRQERRLERQRKLKHARENPARFERFQLIDQYKRMGFSRDKIDSLLDSRRRVNKKRSRVVKRRRVRV